jgi:hypothetical protein
MSDQKPADPFDPFDPIKAAMRAMHQGNMLDAKDARIRQLEERLETLREAGDALAYCFRHAHSVAPEEVMDAMREWKEARIHA